MQAFQLGCNRRDGVVVVVATAPQSVDLGFISQVESYFKKWYSQFPCLAPGIYGRLWRSLLVVSLDKALNGMLPSSFFMWQTGDGAKKSTRRGGPVGRKTCKLRMSSYA